MKDKIRRTIQIRTIRTLQGNYDVVLQVKSSRTDILTGMPTVDLCFIASFKQQEDAGKKAQQLKAILGGEMLPLEREGNL